MLYKSVQQRNPFSASSLLLGVLSALRGEVVRLNPFTCQSPPGPANPQPARRRRVRIPQSATLRPLHPFCSAVSAPGAENVAIRKQRVSPRHPPKIGRVPGCSKSPKQPLPVAVYERQLKKIERVPGCSKQRLPVAIVPQGGNQKPSSLLQLLLARPSMRRPRCPRSPSGHLGSPSYRHPIAHKTLR